MYHLYLNNFVYSVYVIFYIDVLLFWKNDKRSTNSPKSRIGEKVDRSRKRDGERKGVDVLTSLKGTGFSTKGV